jgi:hypothetical protein
MGPNWHLAGTGGFISMVAKVLGINLFCHSLSSSSNMPKYSTSACPNVAKLNGTQLNKNHDGATEAYYYKHDKPLVIGTRCGKIVRMESMSDKLGIFLV